MKANDSNPYRPPNAHVDDVVPLRELPLQPRKVFAAIMLLCVDLVIDVLSAVQDLFGSPGVRDFPLVFSIPIAIVITSLFAWLIWMINEGFNWARVTYVVFLLCGVVWLFAEVTGVFGEPVTLTVGNLVLILLPIVAMVLLFTPSANAWFRQSRRN